jgi:hypothetical protein
VFLVPNKKRKRSSRKKQAVVPRPQPLIQPANAGDEDKLETIRDSNGSRRPQGKQGSRTNWVSMKAIIFFLLLMVAGFLLTSAGTAQNGFQDALFGPGVVLWVVGVLGAVYGIVYRLAGPKAAKLAVVVLILILLSELFFGKRDEKHQDPFHRL